MTTEAAPVAVTRGGQPDRYLVMLTLLLVGAGLVMVLSASPAFAYVQHRFALYYFLRQAGFAGGGLGLMAILARIEVRRLRPLAPALAALALALMLLVLVTRLGITVSGARRWLTLGPLGSFQPSEAGKLAFAFYIAHWLDRRGRRMRSFSDGFLPFAILVGTGLGVLMLQRDLGTALVTGAMLASMYFVGGGRKRHLILLLAILAVAFLLLVLGESYRSQRLAVYLDPFHDPLGAGFQSSQALLALGSGGLTGVGLGHSVAKYQWLPEADTDFIFAIIGEETGLAGTTLVLLGFLLFAVRGYLAASRSPDRFGLALGVGLTTWITFQALLNMAAVTDTLPITGVPLPFISYGGTALAINLAATGVLLSLSRAPTRPVPSPGSLRSPLRGVARGEGRPPTRPSPSRGEGRPPTRPSPSRGEGSPPTRPSPSRGEGSPRKDETADIRRRERRPPLTGAGRRRSVPG